jgi:hypothetical protein
MQPIGVGIKRPRGLGGVPTGSRIAEEAARTFIMHVVLETLNAAARLKALSRPLPIL